MKRRICAQCGAEIVPEGMQHPGAEPCPDCGASRLPDTAPAPVVLRDAQPEVEQVEVFTSEDGRTIYRQFRQGPFVFREYTRQGSGGWGCGCGCLVLMFMVYLMLRGFFSLFS